MKFNNVYSLPLIPFGFNELEPFMSKKQIELHYLKHHQGYVNALNAEVEKIENSRKNNSELDMRSFLKEMSFNFGGHVLHTLFWNTLVPSNKTKKEPLDALYNAIKDEFGDFEKFKKEFSQIALSVEGSGWAALCYHKDTARLMLMQIEKHNNNIFAETNILMVLDVFEHAYYVDYKNERVKYIESFWNIIDWVKIEERYKAARK